MSGLARAHGRRSLVAGIEEFTAASPEWEALCDATHARPFARPGWSEAWKHAFAPDTPLVAVTARDPRCGRLCGAVVITRHGPVITLPSNAHTPSVTAAADDPAAYDVLARTIVQMGASEITVSPLAEDDPFRHSLLRAVHDARYLVVETPLMASPYLDIDPADPLGSISRKLRKEIGRGRRRMEERGPVRLDLVCDPEGGLEALDELIRIEDLGWKGDNGTSIMRETGARDFYRGVTTWAARHGRLQLAVLRVAGRPVAAELDLREGDSHLYSLKAGFDPEFARMGPGQVLVASLFEELVPRGLRRYEMLGEADAYKMRWTTTTHSLRTMTAFRPSPSGLVRMARRRGVPFVARRWETLRSHCTPTAR